MKYFKIIMYIFLIASAVSLAGVFVMQSTEMIGAADTDFKNLPYGIALGINSFFLLGSFTILLNLKRSVNDSTLYNALSFFLVPCVLVILLLFAIWDEPWPGVLFCIPYLVVLFIFFLHSKKQKARSKEPDHL